MSYLLTVDSYGSTAWDGKRAPCVSTPARLSSPRGPAQIASRDVRSRRGVDGEPPRGSGWRWPAHQGLRRSLRAGEKNSGPGC